MTWAKSLWSRNQKKKHYKKDVLFERANIVRLWYSFRVQSYILVNKNSTTEVACENLRMRFECHSSLFVSVNP